MSTTHLWNTLLELSELVRHLENDPQYCVVRPFAEQPFTWDKIPDQFDPRTDFCWQIAETINKDLPANIFFLRRGYEVITYLLNPSFSVAQLEFLKVYLSYCYLPILAKANQRAISVAHFAQSLNGMIATQCGSSRWIGNEENLVHAHRMRAGPTLADNEYLTPEHALAYLAKADDIPHRAEGEAVLLSFIPPSAQNILDLGTGDGRLIGLLRAHCPDAAAMKRSNPIP